MEGNGSGSESRTGDTELDRTLTVAGPYLGGTEMPVFAVQPMAPRIIIEDDRDTATGSLTWRNHKAGSESLRSHVRRDAVLVVGRRYVWDLETGHTR
jgi:hypothetical protein